MASDSCPLGFGGTFGKKFIQGVFPPEWSKLDIMVLELYPIYVLLMMFAPDLRDSTVRLLCDNQAIVSAVNCQTSRNKKVMKLIRPLVLCLLKFKIDVNAVYISSSSNKVCDTLSRQQVLEAQLLSWGLEDHPSPIPAYLLPKNLKL